MNLNADIYLSVIIGEEYYTQHFADCYISTARLIPNNCLTWSNKILYYNNLLKNLNHGKFALP